jgi:predicted signal transduction protein with EAL and GGDEF domain
MATTTLIIFDFNDFKQINDVHGHPVGDEGAAGRRRRGRAGGARRRLHRPHRR